MPNVYYIYIIPYFIYNIPNKKTKKSIHLATYRGSGLLDQIVKTKID